MKKESKIKWGLVLAVFLFISFTVLAIAYLTVILKGEANRLNIISLVIWMISAFGWLLKAIQDQKKINEFKKE